MPKNRSEIHVKGLGNLEVRQVSPTPDADFTSFGHLQEADLEDVYETIKIKNDRGDKIDVPSLGHEFAVIAKCLQTQKEQIDFPMSAKMQYHAARYFGLEDDGTFKLFTTDLARVIPGMKLPMKAGLRTLDVRIESLDDLEQGFDIPQYSLLELQGEIDLTKLRLYADPRQGLNYQQAKVLDYSGYGRHGTLTSAFATMWQKTGSLYYIRLDGVDDDVSFGDVCDINDTTDFYIQIWVRVQGADASQQEIFAKKTADANEAGFRLVRDASNKASFKISDGTNSVTATGSGNILQNVWKLIGIQGDRTADEVQLYLNGAADGAAVDISTVTGDPSNALALIIGKLSTAFGQVDVGGFRIHLYGTAGLPLNIADQALANFNAEKSYFGL